MSASGQTNKDLFVQAKNILKTNSRHDRYTVPSDRLYPYQWNWDSGFIALGWSKVAYERALCEIESLLEGQWKNGMVPHIVFHEYEEDYAPGPLDWQVPKELTHKSICTSGITQPPIIGSVLYRLYQGRDAQHDDKARFTELYQQIKSYHHWFMARRTKAPAHNLCLSLHPWESGMDNSPSWDSLIKTVPEENLAQFRRKDLKGDNDAERPHDADYAAYMSLVYHYRRIGYDAPDLLPQAHFRVFDLVLNSLLLRSARDMAHLSSALGGDDSAYWQAQSAALEVGIQTLWSAEHEAFLNRDAITGELLAPVTNASFLPLYAKAATPNQAAALARMYREWRAIYPYGVATTDPRADEFEMQRYWRGPIWLNTNWMIAEGFAVYGYDDIAAEIKADSLALIRKHGFYEYFTPDGAKGLGAPSFSWSAALALYWLGEEQA
tara:strand:- start:79076 stop:80386 length:1311 start_codon:yes stop_codon:yes gene_type:complete